MAQRTVLELVQGILSESNGDSVNSIADTIEATDVAYTLKQVYLEMVDQYSLPSTERLAALTALSDLALPNVMKIPDASWNIKWIKYDVREDVADDKHYVDIQWMEPHAFIEMLASNPNTDTTNYQVILWTADVPFVINKYKAPNFWTSFDDKYIVFDSYDVDVDNTLQASKSMCLAETRPTFTESDAFVPELPENLENLLYIKALNRYTATRNRELNPKTNQQEDRMTVRAQRNKWRQGKQHYTGPDYGRR